MGGGGGGWEVTWVNFSWVCAAGLSVAIFYTINLLVYKALLSRIFLPQNRKNV